MCVRACVCALVRAQHCLPAHIFGALVLVSLRDDIVSSIFDLRTLPSRSIFSALCVGNTDRVDTLFELTLELMENIYARDSFFFRLFYHQNPNQSFCAIAANGRPRSRHNCDLCCCLGSNKWTNFRVDRSTTTIAACKMMPQSRNEVFAVLQVLKKYNFKVNKWIDYFLFLFQLKLINCGQFVVFCFFWGGFSASFLRHLLVGICIERRRTTAQRG